MNQVDKKALADIDALSEEFGEFIAYDVTDVIGVLVGLKPAALVGGNKQDIDTDLLGRLGLSYTQWPEKNLVYVSRDGETVRRLAELHKKVWGKNATYPDESREIGRLLGYPETATEYFIKRLKTLDSDSPLPAFIPEETKDTVSSYFQNLVLSPDNYKEELASYCEPLEAAVREFAPRTYAVFCALSSRS